MRNVGYMKWEHEIKCVEYNMVSNSKVLMFNGLWCNMCNMCILLCIT